jgi:hypothetical protein
MRMSFWANKNYYENKCFRAKELFYFVIKLNFDSINISKKHKIIVKMHKRCCHYQVESEGLVE